ncbi:MAG: alpha/beta hydrolase [Pseudomonadota bacterium]
MLATKAEADRAYDSTTFIPGGSEFSDRWAKDAAAFRQTANALLDVPYGEGERERYDIFWPGGPAHGLVVYIHGGYWMRFDKSSWSHLAAGPLEYGFAVMMPTYPLCPDERISTITQCVARAIDHVAHKVDGPIIVGGHSAGGHLAARMACRPSPLSPPTAERLQKVISISGLHDLRPLLKTTRNDTFGLTLEEACAESPALLYPAPIDVVAWVGDGERPEFRRQNTMLSVMWQGLARSVRHVEAYDRHHFDVIADLADPSSALTNAFISPD